MAHTESSAIGKDAPSAIEKDASGVSEKDGSAHGAGFVHLDRAQVVQVETPEHVRIGFELAGMGSRSAAMIVDVMILALAAFGILLLFAGIQTVTSIDWIISASLTVVVFVSFGLVWCYFFLAEGFFDGRTLGKRALGLRVIGLGGTPLTLQAAALRNLLRIIYLQPFFSWGPVGFIEGDTLQHLARPGCLLFELPQHRLCLRHRSLLLCLRHQEPPLK
jgi:uncharacterized RDD family membrane protein YckC